MKERIQQFIKAKGISQNTFEEMAGLSCGTVTNMTKGMRTDKFADVLRAFPELNAYWLLGLEDEMYKPQNRPSESTEKPKLCQPLDCVQKSAYETEMTDIRHRLALSENEVNYYKQLNVQRDTELAFLRKEIEHKNKMLEYFSKQ